jgi:hypothetical protein
MTTIKSPYRILDVPQDVDVKTLNRHMATTLRSIRSRPDLTATDVMKAVKTLQDPSKRLAADFTFPVRIKAKRPIKFKIDETLEVIDVNAIDPDAFNSL